MLHVEQTSPPSSVCKDVALLCGILFLPLIVMQGIEEIKYILSATVLL